MKYLVLREKTHQPTICILYTAKYPLKMKEWLGLHASTAGGPGSIPRVAGGLRSYKLHRVAKKKKREREIKTFSDKQKLRKSLAIRLSLEEMF